MVNKWTTTGIGDAARWLIDHVSYNGDDCLLWPFGCAVGYGSVNHKRRTHRAHRLMCALAHGAPPTPKHQAAHSCGIGHCVNPHHLSWKTNGENQIDRRKHGTASKVFAQKKITPEQDVEIRKLRSEGVPLQKLASMFGVTHSTIQYRLYGGSHKKRRQQLS